MKLPDARHDERAVDAAAEARAHLDVAAKPECDRVVECGEDLSGPGGLPGPVGLDERFRAPVPVGSTQAASSERRVGAGLQLRDALNERVAGRIRL